MQCIGGVTSSRCESLCHFVVRIFGTVSVLLPTLHSQTPARELPNIVFITGDDAGQDDLGVYGHPVHSPHLDRIAVEGIRFTNFYVTTSSCSPSRASIWTGKYPHTAGAPNLWDPLPRGERIIPGYLREKGYFTGNVGKLHLGEARGVMYGARQFDRTYTPKTDRIAEEPYSAMDQFLDERPRGRPFFLSVGFKEPHPPFGQRTAPHPHDPEDVWVPPYLPDLPEVRAEIAQYYDEINYLDGWVGRLMARLRREGLEQNTIVLFLGDNGAPFPRAKTTLFDSGTRVPLIVKWPGHIPPGGVADGLASAIDLLPTILEIVGIDTPVDVQGQSILPILLDPDAPGRQYVFTVRDWHDFDDHVRAVRWRHLKYVRNYYPDTPLWPATDLIAGATYQAMLRLLDRRALPQHQAIFFYAVRPEEELYDLRNDPFEFQNLVDRTEYREDLEHLREVLDRWVEEHDDLSPEDHRHYPSATLRSGEKRIRFGHPLPVVPVDYETLIQQRLQLYEDMSRESGNLRHPPEKH